MIKLIKEVRVSNFLNLNYKLILISLVLVTITIFGIKNINSAVKDSTEFSDKIIHSEGILVNVYSSSNELFNINNLNLVLSLNNKYDSISYSNSVKKIRKDLNINDNLINYKLDDLFRKKSIVFKIINDKYSNKNNLITNSNELSLQIRIVLADYYKLKYLDNVKEYRILKSELNYNYNRYILVIITLLILYIILFIFLIKDIKVKNRLEERDSYLISTLMDKVRDKTKDENSKKL
jgi:hypothetical protein